MKKQIRIGITIGDPSGIGPEIIAKALNTPAISRLADFVVIGSGIAFQNIPGIKSSFLERGNVEFIDLKNICSNKVIFGQLRPDYGKASIEYLDKAACLIKSKNIDALVTAPVNKESICRAGYKFHGQTEYLAGQFKVKRFLMLLTGANLRFGLVSRHDAIKDVPRKITRAEVIKVTELTSLAMKRIFGIKTPEIYVCALNPHASDGGIIGDEEGRVISPALDTLRRKIKHLYGPLPADFAIAQANKCKSSAVVAMYHDQALIALKLVAEKSGVNITYGLPFIRTSPLHGTAFNIAGKGIAAAGSMAEAIRTAVKCTAKLQKYF